MAPSNQVLLTQWNWAPSVLLGIFLLTTAYFYAVGPFRRRYRLGPPVSRAQVTYFICADLVLILALLSPLDAIGDTYLFSVHMAQHLLLAALWPPLLLLAVPDWLVRSLLANRIAAAVMRFATYPVAATLVFNVDVFAWHIPYFYNLTLTNESVHIVEHLSFMFLGLVVWWPILSPLKEHRLAYPFQVLYLFANGMIMMVLGIVFTFAPTPFYTPYVAAPRLWDISATTDQEIGGLVMWYPGNLPYAIALIVAFYRWFDGADPSRPHRSRIQPQSPTIGPPVS